MMTILRTPLPDIRLEELEARLDALHEAEQRARLALGEAMLRGLPAVAARAELRRIREDLDGLYSAARIVEARRPR